MIPPPGTRALRSAALALAVLITAGQTANGQPTGAAPKRIGFLLEGDCEESRENISKRLAPLLAARGFVVGRNLSIIDRCAINDQSLLDLYARQLVAEGVDVLATQGTAKTRALQRATTTIPILTGVGDPVGSGFARSLANPGGNITGLSFALHERAEKMLELMREAMPGLAQVVILYGKSYGNETEITAPFARAAKAANIETQLRLVGKEEDVVRALRPAASSRRVAAIAYNIFEVDNRRIAELALRSGVPLVAHEDAYVEAGALLAYRLQFANVNERSAAIFERLLRGTPPSAIPFELPTLSRLIVNKRTAAALKLPLPPTLLLRADRVIE